ncbi:GNAT family N-acetyltransferase [Streptomyces hypolithicus]
MRTGDWEKVRELRLAGLQDPLASIAFLETYERASAQPDSFWQERTDTAAAGVAVRQFVAAGPDGGWAGSVSAIVERVGAEGSNPEPPAADARVGQVYIAGVFVRPEARGSGLAEELFRAALDWAWSLPVPRIDRARLFVHERNVRAEALYRKAGFVRSGNTVAAADDPTAKENEMVVPRPKGA